MINFLKNVGIMIINFCISFGIAYGAFKYMSRGLTGTGTGEMGSAFGIIIISLIIFVVLFILIGAGIYGFII